MKLSSPIALLEKSFKTFSEKENFLFFLKIYLPLLPFTILSVIQSSFFSKNYQDGSNQYILDFIQKYGWVVGVTIIIALAGLIVSYWVSLSGIVAVSEVVTGKVTTFNSVYKTTWKKIGGFFILSFITGLLVIFGTVLLIIPGIIASIWLHFAGFEFLIKGKGIKESMIASKKLVEGRFWKVLGRVVVFDIFFGLFQFLFKLIPLNIGTAIYPLLGALILLPNYYLYEEINSR